MRIGAPIGRPQHPIGKDVDAGGPVPVLITVTELENSQEFVQKEKSLVMVRRFQIFGTVSAIEATPYGPQIGTGFAGRLIAKQRRTKRIIGKSGPGPLDKGLLSLEVEYEEDSSKEGGNLDSDDFETVNETVNIKSVLTDDDQAHYPSGATDVEKVGRNIGETGDGQVQGVSIIVPYLAYTATRYRTSVTTNQLRNWVELAGKVNSSQWFGFAFNEVLFLGATSRELPDVGQWEIIFRFLIRKNRTSSNPIRVKLFGQDGTETTENVTKTGHEYLWYELGGTADKKGARFCHVAKVYEEANFSTLGLGADPPWEE